ncbi:uncharacterized protein [Hemitrygon akajei]|uniref:uncharacterized protein n=1 Tax=Hemitrygon akajei TaxID=2704970 RepID=UPI003BF9B897
MDEGNTYANVKFGETGPQSPSYAESNVSYVEPKLRTLSVPRDRSGGDGMGSERPARRGRSDPSIWLICVLTATLVITGICWRIHVSQIRHSLITCARDHQELWEQYQEANRTQRQYRLQSKRVPRTGSQTKTGVITYPRLIHLSKKPCKNVQTVIQGCWKSIQVMKRNASFRLLYKGSSGTPYCWQCDPTAVSRIYPCNRDQHFICEKSLLPDIPEKIRGLCQQPVDAT